MRTRYVVDNPRGPLGGNHEVGELFKHLSTARRRVRNNHATRGAVLELDFDDLVDVDATPEERWQHAERMMTKWSQRFMETASLVPDLGPLFKQTTTGGGLPAIPELTRADLRDVADAFARWVAWLAEQRATRRGVPYEAEVRMHDALVALFEKLGEAPR